MFRKIPIKIPKSLECTVNPGKQLSEIDFIQYLKRILSMMSKKKDFFDLSDTFL